MYFFFREKNAFNVTFWHLPAFVHSAVGKKKKHWDLSDVQKRSMTYLTSFLSLFHLWTARDTPETQILVYHSINFTAATIYMERPICIHLLNSGLQCTLHLYVYTTFSNHFIHILISTYPNICLTLTLIKHHMWGRKHAIKSM